MAQAMERAHALTDGRFLADLQREVDSLIERGAHRVALWGFCMGGRLAYVAAARVRGLSGVVAYYGFLSAQDGRLSPLVLAREITVPVLGIFGGADPGIPPDQIEPFDRALAGEHEIVTYPGAPHGFLRYGATQHKDAIDDALARTYGFLDRVLPQQVRAASL
jgi:carboxymethylenebutenolidase